MTTATAAAAAAATAAERMADLVGRARDGDAEARDRVVDLMWDRLAALARRVARHHLHRIEADELLTVGAASILRSLLTFDPARGVQYSTFCLARARGAMADHVRRMDPVPRLARQRMKRLDRHADAFRARHGRPPTRDELRDAAGLDEADFARHEQARIGPVLSLFDVSHAHRHDPAQLIDEVAARPMDAGTAPFEARDVIRFALGRYGLRAGLMLKLRFVDGWTFGKIGEVILPSKPGPRTPASGSDGITENMACTHVNALVRRLREDLGGQACR